MSSNDDHEKLTPITPFNYRDIQTNSSIKSLEEFRTYTQDDDTPVRVVEHYRDMRRYQTVEFYERMEKKYSFESEYIQNCAIIVFGVAS